MKNNINCSYKWSCFVSVQLKTSSDPMSNLFIALEKVSSICDFMYAVFRMLLSLLLDTMAESLDEQQQQQKQQDAALVLVKDQVQIPMSNLIIALEKIQPYVIFNQFWYFITQELSTQKFYFQLEDQVIEVNADLLRNALNITPKVQRFIPFHGLPKRNSGGLKSQQRFVPAHIEEVAKSIKTVPARVTCRGKGLLTKNGVEIAVEKVSILKRKRTQAVTKKIGQSEEAIANEANSEATDEEEVEPLVRHRSTSLSIYQKTDQVSEVVQKGLDHSKKLKGLFTPSKAAQHKSDMKKAQKASKNDFFIQQQTKGLSGGSGAIPEVSDELAFKSSNEETRILPEEVSNKADKITKNVEEVAANADEVTEKADEVTKKAEDVVEKDDIVTENIKMIEVEKNIDVQVAEEQLPKTHIGDKGLVATIEPATEAQTDAPMYVAQPENIS
ncbi:hypothetical protein Tco_0890061 [Tanacetum coccineum]